MVTEDQVGRMIISGRNAVFETLNADKTVHKIYVQDSVQSDLERYLKKIGRMSIPVKVVDKNKLNRMTSFSNHQGIAAEIEEYQYASMEDLLKIADEKKEDPFLLILDEIQDPHNMGAMIRSAEAAGCHGVIIQKRRSCSVNDTVYNTSAGAINYIPVAQVTNINQAIRFLKKNFVFVYGTDGYAEDLYTETDLTGPIALVVGNEGKGMRRLVKENCDGLIRIPIAGKTESLNASTACAVVLFEAVRQRNVKG